jgi:iron(III) transport system substrate-binding protein
LKERIMPRLHRRTLLAAGLAAAAIRPARAEGEALVLYNGQHRTTTEALVAAFTKATGIPVTTRNGDSPALAGQLIEEGARSPADLFYSEQSPPVAAVEERGLLAPLAAETVAAVPAIYVSPGRGWIGGSVRTRVVAYNKAMIRPDQLPHSVLDFAAPAWKGRFAYAPKDGFQEQIMAIQHIKGRDAALAWLRGLRENGRMFNGNSAGFRAMEAGEIPVMLTNNYYYYSLLKEKGADNMKSALHYVDRTDVGAIRCLSAAGVLKSSTRQDAAQRFIAFMVSAAGQRAICASVAEYSVRPDVTSPFDLPPLDQVAAAPVNAADFGSAADAYTLQRDAGIA